MLIIYDAETVIICFRNRGSRMEKEPHANMDLFHFAVTVVEKHLKRKHMLTSTSSLAPQALSEIKRTEQRTRIKYVVSRRLIIVKDVLNKASLLQNAIENNGHLVLYKKDT